MALELPDHFVGRGRFLGPRLAGASQKVEECSIEAIRTLWQDSDGLCVVWSLTYRCGHRCWTSIWPVVLGRFFHVANSRNHDRGLCASISITRERAGQAQQQQQSLRPDAKNLLASVGSGLDGLECSGVDFPDCVVTICRTASSCASGRRIRRERLHDLE